MSETEIESILLRNLFSHGADGLAFAPIVAAGDNAAKPHAHARADYRIKPAMRCCSTMAAAIRATAPTSRGPSS